ncbi:hypothetical protein HC928_03665 [bacterium]|nr:hypothetical protein [bacterium]
MTVEDVLQWWSFVFLGVLAYSMGLEAKRLFPKFYEKKWVNRTVVFHAPLVTTLIAVLPIFPMPDAIGGDLGTRILFGCVCGISCAWTYKAFMRLLGKDTKSRGDE